MRNPSITILKALAIIFVVVAQSGSPALVSQFVYMVCASLFFLSAGYCFNPKYLDAPATFVARRFKTLYIPFVLWSIVFLVLNHFWFATGILNEQYGSAQGDVTHPLSLHDGLQALWSIVFNMSSYDQFLCGAYWFFRALLVSSVAFIVLLKLVESIRWFREKLVLSAAAVAVLALCTAFWQISDGLKITGLAQGGYREIVGVFLLAAGFLYRAFNDKFKPAPYFTIPAGLVVVVGVIYLGNPSMASSATRLSSPLLLALGSIAGFCLIYGLANLLNRVPKLNSVLGFIGENTVFVLLFHLLAFKLVSMLKVAVYKLPREMIGGYPYVHSDEGSWFWILYSIVGLALPLGIVWTIKYCADHYNIHNYIAFAKAIGRFTMKSLRFCGHWIAIGSVAAAQYSWKGLRWLFVEGWNTIYNFCVRFIATVKDGADMRQDADVDLEDAAEDEAYEEYDEEYDDEEDDDDEE